MLEIDGSEVKGPSAVERFVILSVHSCDINSFLILDRMFGKEPNKNPYCKRRREKSIVIGIDCEPTEERFCKSMGTDKTKDGFDLFLTEIPGEKAKIIGSCTEENPGRIILETEVSGKMLLRSPRGSPYPGFVRCISTETSIGFARFAP